MSGAITGLILAFISVPLQAIPSTVISNEVYPPQHLDSSDPHLYIKHQLPPKEPPFSLAVQRSMSAVTDLREFIMKYVQDKKICQSPSLRELILGKGESDREANVWWAKRCNRRGPPGTSTSRNLPESTLIRNRRKSSSRSSSQQSPAISKADQKKLNKLLKNKKIQCNPKKTVVELPNEDASFMMLKPSCVYIKQCGGCCESPHLECRPTKEKTRKFKVLALERQGSQALQFSKQTLKKISVKEHVQCQCECKEREEHCSPRQQYDQDACRCYCPTTTDKTCPPGKVWNDKQCECVCSDISDCTTGRYFDTDTCRCADPPH